MKITEINKIIGGLEGKRKQACDAALELGVPDGFWDCVKSGEFGNAAAILLDRGEEPYADMIWEG